MSDRLGYDSFPLQTGLNLLTVNSSSDQSIVDDGISPSVEDKRARSEVQVNEFVEVERSLFSQLAVY